MGKIKYKKQFRLYDIYRLNSIHEMSHIEGIEWYQVTNHCSTISVRYVDATFTRHYVAHNEEELKDVVSMINKNLGNCHKPGRRRYKKTHGIV